MFPAQDSPVVVLNPVVLVPQLGITLVVRVGFPAQDLPVVVLKPVVVVQPGRRMAVVVGIVGVTGGVTTGGI